YLRVTSSPKTRLIISGSLRFSPVTLLSRNSLSSSCTVTTWLPILATTWLFGASVCTSLFLPQPANTRPHVPTSSTARKTGGEFQIITEAPMGSTPCIFQRWSTILGRIRQVAFWNEAFMIVARHRKICCVSLPGPGFVVEGCLDKNHAH